jgi:hypothetical protein
MVETKEKNLTQAQKNYLMKRINEIANAKIAKLGGTTDYGGIRRHYYGDNSVRSSISKRSLGSDALLAITEGTVKLRNKTDLMAEIKSIAENNEGKTYTSIGVLAFIDLESLEKFNAEMDKKKREDYEAKQKRLSSVCEEADKLKDSVMLEGNLAMEMLDKFEKKEF